MTGDGGSIVARSMGRASSYAAVDKPVVQLYGGAR